MNTQDFLLELCKDVYRAYEKAQDERRREIFGDLDFLELLLMRKDKVRIEIRKETVNHNVPHMHIKHSDKIDVSIK